MISKCCTLPKSNYNDLLPEQKKRFGFLVYQYRKKGIPFQRPKREHILKYGVKRSLLIEGW
jgi:hypothetical protein